ncbi:UTP--glucose-1-phosphate uridylyltransferase [Arsukibacterium ikkense]|uniref:UTP--glucose-1-phosphate uridylyltransferase n=1 Tax=Arsukibacterium ikkense TaxID=336831 RepID=A0A0M2VB22_9GAMM|nr:UTP--glucose-1-phosphate uridylyltransferase GalU [Arsukibacterium ikkense]KKO46820.1 UTP--glucose-1-phosphate uridylyltransferase [Arsukibacterium ikkense]
MSSFISAVRSSGVIKAVIPVAGLGTRMLPATKAMAKEMLPVVDRPLIQYVVQEAVAAGITEIVLVTHSSKNSIENHFDTSFELEATLEKRVKRQLLAEVRAIVPKNVTIISVRQPVALGLGHAILCARPVVGNNPFAVLLPDVLVDQYHCNLNKDNLAAMIARFSAKHASQIMVEPVPQDRVHQYGIVDLQGSDLGAGCTAKIYDMVEKPAEDDAPSNYAITGRYVLSAACWDLLEFTPPGAGDEIQLTDALHQLRLIEQLEAYRIVGKSHDCGTKLGLLTANMEYGLRHPTLGAPLQANLQKFIGESQKRVELGLAFAQS